VVGIRNILIVLTLVSGCAFADPEPAQAPAEALRLYRAAQRSERAGDTLHAYLLYARAAALDPANVEYAFRKNALQAKAMLTSETRLEPDPALEPVPADDTDADEPVPAGGDPKASETAALLLAGELSPAEISEARDALPPVRLTNPGARKSFDVVRGEARAVIEQVATAYGIQAIFEPDYQGPPPFNFRVTNLSMEEALRMVETVSNSMIVPVSAKVALVLRDAPQRRADSMPTMSVEVPIPERLSVQEAQEIVTAVQQTMELRKISVDPGRHMVYIRDQVGKVIAARQLFEQLSRPRAQVELEVELLSVSKTSSLAYGMTLPTTSTVVNFGTFLNNVGSAVSSITQFLTFGGGKSMFGLGVTDATLMATLSRGSTESVLRTQVVTADGQPATIHVGDRYPIITNGYYGQTTGTGTVYTPPPTVQFQDLGLSLKVTPSVHEAGEMTLDVDAQYAVLGAATSNAIPIISNQKFQGKVRLADGEWAVIAGLSEADTGDNFTGTWGLANLPWIGRLLRQNNITKNSSEVLILLKPRLVNLPPWEFPTQTLWVGTESKPLAVY
jgi:general secretion pathway protein D